MLGSPVAISVVKRATARSLFETSRAATLYASDKGRIVQDCVDEIVDRATAAHDRLADVYQFGGVTAEDVYAQDLPGVGMHDQLQHAVRSPR